MKMQTVYLIAPLVPLAGVPVVLFFRRAISYRLARRLVIAATLLLAVCALIGVWLVVMQKENFYPWILACCSLCAFANAIPSGKHANHLNQPKADK
jgi:peptidoglycan/LPS O-acetylase OafA/YrhL